MSPVICPQSAEDFEVFFISVRISQSVKDTSFDRSITITNLPLVSARCLNMRRTKSTLEKIHSNYVTVKRF